MAEQTENSNPCFLISIDTTNRDSLFDSYRDYLVFMSLVRDGVRCCQYKIFGFCWLKDKCWMLIQSESNAVGTYLLRLLKRYHFWLLQRGPEMTEFRLQMLELQENSWILDSLRFIHQQAVKSRTVDDAMDYHWHSHQAYSGFWTLNWLDIDSILNQFSTNQLAAMSRFRQYMQHPHRLDFGDLIEKLDCSIKYTSANIPSKFNNVRKVAEINSPYHQSMFDRTEINFVTRNGYQCIQISVAQAMEAENINHSLKPSANYL